MARWQGKKDSDPKFWACGPCIVMLRRQGLKVRQIQEE